MVILLYFKGDEKLLILIWSGPSQHVNLKHEGCRICVHNNYAEPTAVIKYIHTNTKIMQSVSEEFNSIIYNYLTTTCLITSAVVNTCNLSHIHWELPELSWIQINNNNYYNYVIIRIKKKSLALINNIMLCKSHRSRHQTSTCGKLLRLTPTSTFRSTRCWPLHPSPSWITFLWDSLKWFVRVVLTRILATPPSSWPFYSGLLFRCEGTK